MLRALLDYGPPESVHTLCPSCRSLAVPALQESAAAAYMMHRFGAVLGADQFGQLKGWLRRCALNGLNAPQPPLDIYFTRHFRGFLSRPQLGARNADAAAPSSSTAAR